MITGTGDKLPNVLSINIVKILFVIDLLQEHWLYSEKSKVEFHEKAKILKTLSGNLYLHSKIIHIVIS